MRKGILFDQRERPRFSKRGKSSNTNVSNSLLRGRAALEEAENHIKIFDEYLKQKSSQDATTDFAVSMKKKVGKQYEVKTVQSDEILSNFDETFSDFQLPEMDQFYADPNEPLDPKNGYSMEVNLINQMMKRGEEKQKRDELMQNDFSFAKNIISSRIHGQRNTMQKNRCKLKRKGHFDPKELYVAKRAVVKASILAENHATMEAEMKKKTEFKAKPLPNGSHVKNDPYALTKAAMGKLSQCQATETGNRKNRLEASTILGGNHECDFKIASPKKHHDPPRTRKDRSTDFVYNEITDMIEKEQKIELDPSEIECQSVEENEKDLACLHQQISKLQAELNLKRMQCIQAIEEIKIQGPDEKDVAMEYDFVETSSNKQIVSDDRHKEKKAMKHSSKLTTNGKVVTELKQVKSNTSLYDRHYLWLKMREAKRKDAKEREDLELVKDVTGKPNLHGAQESWIRAKQQHDGRTKSLQLKDESLRAERQEKDRAIREKQFEEIERLKTMTSKKNKLAKNGIDGKQQLEYVNKLSRPISSRRKKKALISTKPTFDEVEPECNVEKCEDQGRTNGANKEEMSFADMDDKEFSTMIRKLKAKASKGKRTVFPVMDDHNEHQQENLESSVDDFGNCSEDMNLQHIKEPSTAVPSQNGRFISGSAQAKLFAEINDSNSKQDVKKNERLNKKEETKKDEIEVVPITSRQCFPYQHYECGEIPFFDRSSSMDKGRFRVRDAREYHTDSLRRVPVSFKGIPSCEGVMLLVGKEIDRACNEEDVVTVLFQRSQFSEEEASKWWKENKNQIIP